MLFIILENDINKKVAIKATTILNRICCKDKNNTPALFARVNQYFELASLSICLLIQVSKKEYVKCDYIINRHFLVLLLEILP